MTKRLLGAFLLLLVGVLCLGQASAYWQSRSQVSVSGAAAYVGPGDLVSGAHAWYGLRAYNAAVAATGTQKSINIRRTSDSTTTDILILTDGTLDVATATTFCAATSCFVATWYDQASTHNATQATTGKQPQLIFNYIGSLPCVRFVVANATILNATISALSQPVSYSFVFSTTTNNQSGGTQSIMSAFTGGSQHQVYYNGGSQVVLYAGSFLTDPTTRANATNYAVQTVFNNTSSQIYVNGTAAITGATSTGATSTSLSLGGRPGNSQYGDQNICEGGIWNLDNTSSFSALNGNQRTYWGF